MSRPTDSDISALATAIAFAISQENQHSDEGHVAEPSSISAASGEPEMPIPPLRRVQAWLRQRRRTSPPQREHQEHHEQQEERQESPLQSAAHDAASLHPSISSMIMSTQPMSPSESQPPESHSTRRDSLAQIQRMMGSRGDSADHGAMDVKNVMDSMDASFWGYGEGSSITDERSKPSVAAMDPSATTEMAKTDHTGATLRDPGHPSALETDPSSGGPSMLLSQPLATMLSASSAVLSSLSPSAEANANVHAWLRELIEAEVAAAEEDKEKVWQATVAGAAAKGNVHIPQPADVDRLMRMRLIVQSARIVAAIIQKTVEDSGAAAAAEASREQAERSELPERPDSTETTVNWWSDLRSRPEGERPGSSRDERDSVHSDSCQSGYLSQHEQESEQDHRQYTPRLPLSMRASLASLQDEEGAGSGRSTPALTAAAVMAAASTSGSFEDMSGQTLNMLRMRLASERNARRSGLVYNRPRVRRRKPKSASGKKPSANLAAAGDFRRIAKTPEATVIAETSATTNETETAGTSEMADTMMGSPSPPLRG